MLRNLYEIHDYRRFKFWQMIFRCAFWVFLILLLLHVSIILDFFWPVHHYFRINTLLSIRKTGHFLNPPTQTFSDVIYGRFQSDCRCFPPSLSFGKIYIGNRWILTEFHRKNRFLQEFRNHMQNSIYQSRKIIVSRSMISLDPSMCSILSGKFQNIWNIW